jgi:sugar phosphate isomerase/epimerase
VKKLLAILGVALLSVTSFAGEEQWKPRFALQLYSFRDRSFMDAVKSAKKIGFQYVEAYPGQKLGGDLKGTTNFPMSAENRQKVAEFLAKENVKLISYGVANANNENGWKELFDFARDMKIEIIQTEAGKDAKTLDLLNKMAETYKIKVAFHNHEQKNGFPDRVAVDLKGRPFLGSGADLGHWAAAGVVPLDGVKKLEGRFFTTHMVEMSTIGKDKDGKASKIVPFGKGASDLAKVLDELKRQKFTGTVTCEYERVTPTLEEEIGECMKWWNDYFSKK